jgi:hypothetical protein
VYAFLYRWRYAAVTALLGALMLTLVVVLRPDAEAIALCFLAWFGGVGAALTALSYGENRP